MTENELIKYLNIGLYENVNIICKEECKLIKELIGLRLKNIHITIDDYKEKNPSYNNRLNFLFDLDINTLINRLKDNQVFLNNTEWEYQKNISGFVLSFTKIKNPETTYQLFFHNYSLEDIPALTYNFKLKDFDLNKVKKFGNLYI